MSVKCVFVDFWSQIHSLENDPLPYTANTCANEASPHRKQFAAVI